MLLEMAAVSILGGILCLDRTCLQIMVSRPVVIAPLCGWALGDPLTGLAIGAFLELLWVDKQQIGIYVPPNDSLLAVVIVTAILLAFPRLPELRRELAAFAFLALTPLSYLTKRMDAALIRGNEALADRALQASSRGDMGTIGREHRRAIYRTLASYAIFLFLASGVGILLLRTIFPLLSDHFLRVLRFMYGIIPLALVAVCLNTINFRRLGPIFCALALTTVIVIELINGF
ncbi:MAG: PTS sugar transporter subunit IIC [Pseudomonadota bacterium]|nr:PTS sugar transporter subunit IIC [Pseudomonadota bacterium]